MPEPIKSKTGNNNVPFFSDFSSFTEDRYTAIKAIIIPTIFKKVTDSLYKIIPKITGTTTDILPEIEVTETPFS